MFGALLYVCQSPAKAQGHRLGRLPTASSAVQHGSAVQGWLAFDPLRKAASQPVPPPVSSV